jgi:signal transduction histidine kinase
MQAVVRDEIYSIGCEAIRNVAEHSTGSKLAVEIVYGIDLDLTVRDDGKVIDQFVAVNGKDGHFGIRGMRERADRVGAQLTIVNSKNAGTEVCLMVPATILAWSPDPNSRLLSRLRSFFGRTDHAPPLR